MISSELYKHQRSVWTLPNFLPISTQNKLSLDRVAQKDLHTQVSLQTTSNSSWTPLKWFSSMPVLVKGVLLGAVINCLVLTVVLPIWLVKPTTTTSGINVTMATATTLTTQSTATTMTTTTSPSTSTSASTSTTTTSISTSTSTLTTTTTTTTTTSSTTTTTTTTQGITVTSALWPFDNNTLELFNSYDGVAGGNPSYTTSVLGYGASISIDASSAQSVIVTTKQVLFNSTSFTIEAWIYPISLTLGDFGIFGQCQSANMDLCLHFIIRNLYVYCGFFSNDVAGSTVLTMNQWSHVACVYDSSATTQQVWLNGILDGTRTTSAYQGSSGATTIGMISYLSSTNFSFNGYLDQVQYEPRAKSAYELLNDATLGIQYSFDGGSILDQGPNGINGTLSGNATSVAGRVNEALQFGSGAYLYVAFKSLYFLGVSNYPFTLSLWVKPTGSYANSTLFHVTAGWCIGLLTMTPNGNIMANLWDGSAVGVAGPVLPLNSWNHIGYTYSSTNGICLYVNGTLYSTSGAFYYSASGTFTQVVLAGNLNQTWCSPLYGGAFTGALDELYLYSRELSSSEIYTLANP